MCLVHDGPRARYGSREAPVVSRLGTTLSARRSLEGDLKVVLSFPGFGGERAWKWFRARNAALCRAGRVLLSRASRPIRSSLDSSLGLRLSSTRRQHSGRSGVLASLRNWSPRLGQRAYAAGVLSFRFAVADGVAPARRPRAVSLVKGAARHRCCRDRGAERHAILRRYLS